MNAQELKERTKQFAFRVMRVVEALPNTPKGRAIANQLVRSGTSVAANYRGTCGARSRAEFISKIGVVEGEADETALWLELIIADKVLPAKKVVPLLDEANELVAIAAALSVSASRNERAKNQSVIGNQQSPIKSSYISASRNKRNASAKSAIRNQQSAIRS